MPQKARITKEMIVEQGFLIARTQGIEKVTARSIAEGLKCSTQPIIYCFSSVEKIKTEIYNKANEYHTYCLMNLNENCENPMLEIGLNYVKFAVEEKYLFRLLFQSNEFSDESLMDIIQSSELDPIMQVLQQIEEITIEEAREVFSMIFIYVHGYASLFANNQMKYNEDLLIKSLEKLYLGAINFIKECKK